jgi:hypothetical protein
MITASARSRAETTRERTEAMIMSHSGVPGRCEQYFPVAGGVVVCCSAAHARLSWPVFLTSGPFVR